MHNSDVGIDGNNTCCVCPLLCSRVSSFTTMDKCRLLLAMLLSGRSSQDFTPESELTTSQMGCKLDQLVTSELVIITQHTKTGTKQDTYNRQVLILFFVRFFFVGSFIMNN